VTKGDGGLKDPYGFGGGGENPSYNNVVANEAPGDGSNRPSFKSSPQLREQILQDEQ